MQFHVRDVGLTEFGRKELSLAGHGMPGLLACGEEFGPIQSLRVLSIDVSLHTTIQTDVLVETLLVLGATVRRASSNIFSTRGHARAHIAKGDTLTVCDWNGGMLPEHWRCTEQRVTVPGADGCQPFKGLNINEFSHMTVQSDMFVETLQVLGATLGWRRTTSSASRVTLRLVVGRLAL